MFLYTTDSVILVCCFVLILAVPEHAYILSFKFNSSFFYYPTCFHIPSSLLISLFLSLSRCPSLVERMNWKRPTLFSVVLFASNSHILQLAPHLLACLFVFPLSVYLAQHAYARIRERGWSLIKTTAKKRGHLLIYSL
jgi:hypothetical protein